MSAPQIHEIGCRATEYLDGRTPGSPYCHCRQIRAARSDQIPDRPAHFTWLQGPAEKPDPEPPDLNQRIRNAQRYWQPERSMT